MWLYFNRNPADRALFNAENFSILPAEEAKKASIFAF
jgi:hypothetical protein